MSVREDLTCREVVELVSAYLEGELEPNVRDRVDTHLSGCDGCTMVLDQFRDTIRLTGTLREDDLTEAQRTTIRDAFRGWRGSGSPPV